MNTYAKKALRTLITGLALSTALLTTNSAMAREYQFDIKGAHAFIQFQIKHLGFSWLSGRFNKFDGTFNWDAANPNASSVNVEIDVASLDSMHAERDKHLRGEDYLNVDKYPQATFTSTSYTDQGDGKGLLKGNLNLRGVTKEIAIDVEFIGAGKSPWGAGLHAGFRGTVALKLEDFGMRSMGPGAEHVYMTLDVEGISK
ncbi:YceI family protein [Porticoccus sp. W117]|uniref:YceI family protein n=1 Tax=Porticoccus sp. W117 TaxID=3054777 RepID=UPI00259AD1F0|nr:YceI family protein [Porticoccus sp. W117]MDM3872554.1 YceI family protein [Porticoccus sp. W117]